MTAWSSFMGHLGCVWMVLGRLKAVVYDFTFSHDLVSCKMGNLRTIHGRGLGQGLELISTSL